MSGTRKPNNVKQHEPLRVPKNWSADDRAMVIQLNGQLDEIYAKLGEAQKTMSALGLTVESDGEQIEALSNKLGQYAPIKIASTGSKTLSANGNISHTFDKKAIIISAYSNRSDIVCTAFPTYNSDSTGNTTWWIHCRSATSDGTVASGDITCYLLYVDTE